MGKEMDFEFSEGFINDLSTLMDLCQKFGTDNVNIVFKKFKKELKVNVSFGLMAEGGVNE